MPRESLDVPDNLLKEAFCQGGVGELQGEIPGRPRMRRPSVLEQRCWTRLLDHLGWQCRACAGARRRATERGSLGGRMPWPFSKESGLFSGGLRLVPKGGLAEDTSALRQRLYGFALRDIGLTAESRVSPRAQKAMVLPLRYS